MQLFVKQSITVMFVLLLFGTTFSQTYEQYKKIQNDQLNEFKLQQEKEIAKLVEEYDAYVKMADKEFTDFLKNEWEEYNAFKALKIPKKPKPAEIPVAKPGINLSHLSTKEIKVLLPTETPVNILNKPVLPLVQKTEPPNYNVSLVKLDYYGNQLSFEYDNELIKTQIQSVNEKAIGNWWQECSNTNYNQLVNQLLSTKSDLSLNDWAYFMLVNKTSNALNSADLNSTRLLTWFLLIRSGYNVKVAFSNNEIFLLFPSSNELYGKSYLMIGNKRYYFQDNITSDTFQTYDFDFPGATRIIDFNIYHPLNIGNDVAVKQIKFKHLNKDYSFPVSINLNTLYFLKDYPIVDLSVSFNSVMSRVTKQSLAEGLVPLLHDMNNDDALNLLLSFVQKSFIYKTDQEQFNKEKFFFPEELFYYKASDCEDRSALFAYIVKQLLHLEVIGLEYSGHVATAVRINEQPHGDYLIYNDNEYVIADPTYINAPLGLSMPKYKNKTAKVIETNNTNYLANVSGEIWKVTNDMGGYRGNNLCDSKYDSQGNCYLTGYYNDEVHFADENWYSKSGLRQPFIVKYNKNNEVIWAKKLSSNGMASGFSITLDKNENPIVAGSFSGDIMADGFSLLSENNREDIFVASYGSDGNIRWLEKAGLDTIDYSQFLNYVIGFDNNGKHKKTNLYLENALNTSNGIFSIENSIALVGGFNFTISYSTKDLAFEDANDFNTISYLKEESDLLIANSVNKSIAGLLAVINLIKSSGMVIPGKDAQKALDKYNPGFKFSSPSIYENIGKVTFMKNNSGIISVHTNNNKSVSFDKIKISNGAKLKITSLQNGNKQIDILSGIEVGKAFIWYDLNFVRMINNTGDLVFDYDTDHTQKTVNMKEDILD